MGEGGKQGRNSVDAPVSCSNVLWALCDRMVKDKRKKRSKRQIGHPQACTIVCAQQIIPRASLTRGRGGRGENWPSYLCYGAKILRKLEFWSRGKKMHKRLCAAVKMARQDLK